MKFLSSMVNCPHCQKEFLPKDIQTEVFQAEESSSGKPIGKAVMFSCPQCHVFLGIQPM
jgi:hypothetical protein